jgi:multiple antibiotic resistance protein
MIDDLIQLGKLISLGLALMLPLANPLTSMTLLLSLGQQIPYKERERQVTQAAFYVVGIMLVTYYAGAWIMHTFGISIPGLRIAGGLIVVSIGFSMLFPKAESSTLEAEVAADAQHQRQTPNIAFVPLALPGTAGPGTIAMIISGAASVDHRGDAGHRVRLAGRVLLDLPALGRPHRRGDRPKRRRSHFARHGLPAGVHGGPVRDQRRP